PARLQSAMKIVYEGGPDAAFERGLALIIGGLEKMRLTTNDIEVLKNVDE
ncbi:TetR/AcrR family transcriptional regulator C-terminal domain-containing protein, partial [Staphylococcus aureus]